MVDRLYNETLQSARFLAGELGMPIYLVEIQDKYRLALEPLELPVVGYAFPAGYLLEHFALAI